MPPCVLQTRIITQALHQGAFSAGNKPHQSLLQVHCLMGHLSPAFVSRSGHPYSFTILVTALVQELCKVIVEMNCCTLMALNHSATMACMMWSEECFLIYQCTPKDCSFAMLLLSLTTIVSL